MFGMSTSQVLQGWLDMAELETAKNVMVQLLAHLYITHIMLGILLLKDSGNAGIAKCCRLLLCSHNFLKQLGRA